MIPYSLIIKGYKVTVELCSFALMCFTSKDEDKNNPSLPGSVEILLVYVKRKIHQRERSSLDHCCVAMTKYAVDILRGIRHLLPNCQQF